MNVREAAGYDDSFSEEPGDIKRQPMFHEPQSMAEFTILDAGAETVTGEPEEPEEYFHDGLPTGERPDGSLLSMTYQKQASFGAR